MNEFVPIRDYESYYSINRQGDILSKFYGIILKHAEAALSLVMGARLGMTLMTQNLIMTMSGNVRSNPMNNKSAIEKLNKYLEDGLTPAERMKKLELKLLGVGYEC